MPDIVVTITVDAFDLDRELTDKLRKIKDLVTKIIVIDDAVVKTGTSIPRQTESYNENIEKFKGVIEKAKKEEALNKLRQSIEEAKLETTEAEPCCEGRNCPECNSILESDWVHCAFCGTSLNFKCSSCGAKKQKTWANCPYCGTYFDN